MTKQRELILNLLQHSDRHLTADEIFFLAKLQMPSIAMATVYNNLNAMTDAGVISRVHVDGSADCFDRTVGIHDHMICDRCGRISNLRLPGVAESIRASLGSELLSYDLTVHSICAECKKKAK